MRPILTACIVLMFAIAAVCLVPLTDEIQNDFVKRLQMWKIHSIDYPAYTLTEYDDYAVCPKGRDREGINLFVAIARMSCGQEDDGNLQFQF